LVASGEAPCLDKTRDPGFEVGPFSMVERLLRQPELPRAAPADLDHHEPPWRAGVDCDDVKLAPTEVDVARQDLPAPGRQPFADKAFGRVAGLLSVRSFGHGSSCGPSVERLDLLDRAGLVGLLAK
jgi:hypothetical protein